MGRRTGGSRRRSLLRLAGSAALGAAAGWLLFSQVTQVFRIEGESMEPALCPGQRVVVDKLGFRFRGIGRGDVIVFRAPDGEQTAMVKRVIALPGETVQFLGDEIAVLGAPESRAPQDHPSPEVRADGGTARSVFVEAGHYFVAGDNRSHSSDSRRFGLLAEGLLIGEAVFRVYPPGRITAPAP